MNTPDTLFELENGMAAALSKMSHEEKLDTVEMCCEGAFELISSGKSKEGYRMLQKIGNDFADCGEAWAILAKTYGRLGQNRVALAYSSKAALMILDDAKVWSLMGLVHYRHNDFHRALAVLEKSVSLESPLNQSFILLAIVKQELNHNADEIEAISRQAVERFPEDPEVWQWLAAYLEERGRHEESGDAHARYCQLMRQQNVDQSSQALTVEK